MEADVDPGIVGWALTRCVLHASACSRQAYRILNVTDVELREEVLASSIGYTNFGGTHSACLTIWVADFCAIDHPRDVFNPVVDCAAAATNFCKSTGGKRYSKLLLLNRPIRPEEDRFFRRRLNLRRDQKIAVL